MKHFFISWQQKRLLKKIHNIAVEQYLQTPLPIAEQPLWNTEFLALDFETTGLNAKKEAILSIGYTVIRGDRICLRDNGHHIIRVNKPLSDHSVAIHKITEERSKQGEQLHHVIEILLAKMAGRVLIVHFASIEKNFLNAAFQQLYAYKLPMLMIDTLELEKRKLQSRQQIITATQLRLFNLRNQYGLPRYNAHNALEDAIATAELFLAQMRYKGGNTNDLILKDVLSY